MMKTLRAYRIALYLSACGWASQVLAGGGPGVEIPLHTDSQGASAADAEVHETIWGEPRIRNVTRPTLTAFLPEVAKATGAAVIVAPGGGFMMLSVASEGEDVAHWLNEHGVAAFVLKYRLNPTPADTAAFQASLQKLMASAAESSSSNSRQEIVETAGARQAMADGLEAVKEVRRRAREFQVDPHRIGILGFSAGAIVAMSVAMSYDAQSRPDFVGSIYGALPPDKAVPKDAPPVFLAVAADDTLLAHSSAPVFDAWQSEHHAAELHIYHVGGHGFGMKLQGHSSDHWIDEFGWWMDSEGFLKVARTSPGGAPPSSASAQPSARPWSNTRLSPDQRAALLNRELTLDERITMVHGIMAIPSRGGPIPSEAILAAGYVPGVPRLGIPALFESDASLGVANPRRIREGDGGTALPSGLALAATFNPALAYAGGAMIGSEARAKGFNVLLAGGVNLTREPRNGRNFEYLGEDPLLAGTLAGESIRGIQSNHIISTAKHFVLNDQETGRHVVNELIDPSALRESDLLAFELAIEGGHPGSIMCSYNKLNGPYACGNDFLLNHVLKGDWGYPGWVMSDWGAVYATDFAARGLDQESGEQLDQQVWFAAPLRAAVQAGTIPPSRLEDMTRRILRSMFVNGLFDYPIERVAVDYAAHAQVARKEASEGIVLLRNQDGMLPLTSGIHRILVVGGHADLGTPSGGGSSQVFPPHTDPGTIVPLGGGRSLVFQSSSILAAIRARAPNSTVTFYDGRYVSQAAAMAKQSDVVILFGTQWTTESEDVPDLTLPSGQDDLINAVTEANPHTVVVLETGGPVAMPWLAHSAAVLEAWYPGAGGADAIADILFGVVNPSGHLPITFPTSVGPLPGFGLPPGQSFDAPHPQGSAVGYRQADSKPLFPFGYGLSYSHFDYQNLKLANAKALTVSFNVRNDSAIAGKEVAQVYLTSATGETVKRLIGFTKVELAPNREQQVQITVDPRLLSHFDDKTQRWHLPRGTYHIEVGASSQNTCLSGDIRLPETWRKP